MYSIYMYTKFEKDIFKIKKRNGRIWKTMCDYNTGTFEQK